MPFRPPNNFPPLRMQLAGNNNCVDHSPDLRFCAVTGDGQPAASALGPIRAQNNHHINITNQPGAIIDVGKIQDMISPIQNPAPGILPLPTPRLPAQYLDNKDLRLTLSNKRTNPQQPLGHPAPGLRIPAAPSSLQCPLLPLQDSQNHANDAATRRGKRTALSPRPSRVYLPRPQTTVYPTLLPPSLLCRKNSRPRECELPLPHLPVHAPRLLRPGHLLTSTPTPCLASPSGTATSRCPLRSAAGHRPPELLTCGHPTGTRRSWPCGIRTPCCVAGHLAAARLPAPLGPFPPTSP
jgi:hypothetical protein